MTRDFRIAKALVFTLAGLVVLGFGFGGLGGLLTPVSAQVGGENFEIFRGESGPFELALAVSPREPVVGGVHFSVQLLDAATMNPVSDARILLVADDEEGVPTIQTLVLNTPQAPESYEGNLTFSLPARWTLRVEIDSATLGSATFRVPLVVKSGTPIENPLGTYVYLGVVAVLVGGTVYVGFSARKARRRRAAV